MCLGLCVCVCAVCVCVCVCGVRCVKVVTVETVDNQIGVLCRSLRGMTLCCEREFVRVCVYVCVPRRLHHRIGVGLGGCQHLARRQPDGRHNLSVWVRAEWRCNNSGRYRGDGTSHSGRYRGWKFESSLHASCVHRETRNMAQHTHTNTHIQT